MRRAALLLALLLPGCECFRVNPVTGKSELSLYSDQDEIALGAQAAPSMEQESGGLYKDPSLEAYVASVGARLAAASDRKEIPHRYRILNSGIVNAFALPGGFVYISRGLLARLHDESELAAVLGHETGHVAARHGVHHLQLSMGLNVLLNIASRAAARSGPESAASAKAGLDLANLVANLGSLKYSRDDERQADHLGIVYAERAGWDPRGMLGLMKVLQSSEQGEPGAFDAMLRTHPLTSERIRNAEAELADRNAAEMSRRTRSTDAFDQQIDRLRMAEKAYARHEKARGHLAKGQLLEAQEAEDEAIRMDPMQAPFFATRAAVALRKHAPREALKDAGKASALDPGLFEGAFLAGLAHLELGEPPQARSALLRASGLWPGHPGAPYYLGILAEREGRREEALARYRQAAGMDPQGLSYGKGAAEALSRLAPAP